MVPLADRGVVAVGGADAHKLLQSVITNDLDALGASNAQDALGAAPALHTGLLTPQGKILFDFFVVKTATAFRLDVARDQAAALVKRLTMYKLRADVQINDVSDAIRVFAVWDGEPWSFYNLSTTSQFTDPRLTAMGLRILASTEFADSVAQAINGFEAPFEDYDAHRIGLGVPEGGKDYAFGDAFPHEALFDQLNGVSFTKGCYVGQEIVSRMEHRGTARKRILPVTGNGLLPPPGTEIKAGEITIGVLGSVAASHALALLRLDRVSEFMAKGVPLTAGNVEITVHIPSWATFSLPPIEPQTGTP